MSTPLSQNRNKAVLVWLYIGCAMVAAMVIIGGITRLTQSGLSMVDWKLFMGMIPPLNDQEWISTFEQYKRYPEYQKINFNFSLTEFKSIFFWEYLHRFIGRLIGIVFFIPFIIFLIQKKIPKTLLPKLILMMLMGAFQGFLGWYMVKSGLIDNPHVSHIRLAIHLSAAFILFCYIFWVALGIQFPKQKNTSLHKDLKLPLILLSLATGIQIVYGAFVAGLKAGKFFNTYPSMDGQFIPDALSIAQENFGFWNSLLNDVAGVQFMHRYIAILVVLLVAFLYIKVKKAHIHSRALKAVRFMKFAITGQFILGIITLLFAVPVSLGVLHQFGALVFLASLIFTWHELSFEDQA